VAAWMLQSLTGPSETTNYSGEDPDSERFNPSQVRLKLPELTTSDANGDCFNPSQVRLKRDKECYARGYAMCFNPSQVRLKPARASRRDSRSRSFNPSQVRLKRVGVGGDGVDVGASIPHRSV